jgi:hypothetical protein
MRIPETGIFTGHFHFVRGKAPNYAQNPQILACGRDLTGILNNFAETPTFFGL